MLVAKVAYNSGISQLLTYYKLKILVCRRGSYGGFHWNEITKFTHELHISRQTLVNHIKFLIDKDLIIRDSTNPRHFRVTTIFKDGWNTGANVSEEILLSWTTLDLKAFLLEIGTENLLGGLRYHAKRMLKKNRGDIHSLPSNLRSLLRTRKDQQSKFNGLIKGNQLKKECRPISCSFQGLCLGIHKSTVSRWRKQNSFLYHHKIEVTDIPVTALDHLKVKSEEFQNTGRFFIGQQGKLCYQYITQRESIGMNKRVKRKLDPKHGREEVKVIAEVSL